MKDSDFNVWTYIQNPTLPEHAKCFWLIMYADFKKDWHFCKNFGCCCLNICLPKLINSTGYWLQGLKQLVCAQPTHIPNLNYQQKAYYYMRAELNYPHFQTLLSQDINWELCSNITGTVDWIQIFPLPAILLERRLGWYVWLTVISSRLFCPPIPC